MTAINDVAKKYYPNSYWGQEFKYDPNKMQVQELGDIISVNGKQTLAGKVLFPQKEPTKPTKPQQTKPPQNSLIGKTVNFYMDEPQRQLIGTFKIDNLVNKNQTIKIYTTDLRQQKKLLLLIKCERLISAQKRGINPGAELFGFDESDMEFYNKQFMEQINQKFCKADFAQNDQQSNDSMV